VDRPLEIFFSYAHEDEDLMNDVRRQLIVYETQREFCVSSIFKRPRLPRATCS
jgi:hypothetical protein